MISETEKERRRKISVAMKGRTSPMKGRNQSDRAKYLIGIANKGKKLSDDTKKKLSLSKIGKKNPQWKGGITPLTKKIRQCDLYVKWRTDIFVRDDYTCVLCGRRGGYIEADHHPKLFWMIMSENNITTLAEAIDCLEMWDIDNGRTVCKKCHPRPGMPSYDTQKEYDTKIRELQAKIVELDGD